MTDGYPTPSQRLLITIPAMLASTMVAVDITIANVALPHMQSSLSASQDQIVWVLTSYLVAGAIATPLSGWLAGHFGRRLVMAASTLGFTLASALCGLSNDLQTIVFARILQGACGAALIPLSQALLLDINRPEEHARAMAIFGLGSMAGPIIGPSLGGYLTDVLSWRWVFFINVPFGLTALAGMLAFSPRARNRTQTRFDIFGFMAISVALGAFQLMLDRGEQLDWFESTEIQIYAVIVAMGVYLTAVHMFTARDTFIKPELFKDRNFVLGCIASMAFGVVAFATIPLIVIMTQTLIGYDAFRTGMVGMPRAFGTLVAIIVVGRLANHADKRVLIVIGLAITAYSMLLYARMDLGVDEDALLWAGLVQGVGGGLIFVPLSVIVFSTMDQKLRNEGAAMYSLTRNVGNAIGLSFLHRELIHQTAGVRHNLVEGVRPDNPLLDFVWPDFDFNSVPSMAQATGQIARQAAMVGNVNIYEMVLVVSLLIAPLIMMMSSGRHPAGKSPQPAPLLE